MFSAGFLTIGRWRGIPLRIHWSTPFGAYIFCGFQFVAPFWLAFFLLVILHELGHAFVVRRVGGTVLSVELTAIGGCCNWSGELTPLERSCVGWGGVGAQLLLLAAALAWRRVHGPPTSTAMAQFAGVFIRTNLWLIAINLLPVAPLDGSEAWPLLPLLWRRFWKRHRAQRALQAQEATLIELQRRDALETQVLNVPAEVKSAVDNLFAELKDNRTKP